MPTSLSRGARSQLIQMYLIVAALLSLSAWFAPSAVAAASWWNADWQYRKGISIKLPSIGGENAPAEMVLPIRLHAGNFQYFQDLQPGGTDLRFVTDEGTPLKYQLEKLDASVGVLIAWIEIPVRAGVSEQKVWMYYGNARATAPGAVALYDADQSLVLHFAETQGLPQDATAYHNDAAASTAQAGVPGVLGNGVRLDGHGAVRVTARPGLGLSPNAGFTFTAWVQLDDDAPRTLLYSQAQNHSRVEIGIANSKLYADVASDTQTTHLESTGVVPAHEWHHVAVALGAANAALYIDGMPAGSNTGTPLPQINADVLIGGDGVHDGGLIGVLDEVGISRVVRSPWWVRVNALGAAPDTTVVAYGTDESKGSSSKLAAYFAMMRNLLSQVSLDGLVVITITALMGLASFQVLVSKGAFLGRVERQDASFLAEFGRRFSRDVAAARERATVARPAQGSALDQAGDGSVAANPDAADAQNLAASGLYAMHRAGLGGLEAALGASGRLRDTLRLSTEGFEAVRAALDAELVEGTNRLNAGLVTMTVAIAGAPFLGLLGTVVGVMITFASIAAAGDVNVNTIAPGVAAAMTATVVGLLVAIPSLFGYNWLATRIARRTSAMEVFADQFLSRLALLTVAAAKPDDMGAAGHDEPEPARVTEKAYHAA